jgi:hypothetical protein
LAGTEDDEDGVEHQPGRSEELEVAADDFLHRSHYCNSNCKFKNQYCSWLFMLCCEGCDEWFHGKCLGLKEGTINQDQSWVCSQGCLEDLPLALRTMDVVVGVPKRKYKKREPKDKRPDDANKASRKAKHADKMQDRAQEEEEEEEEEEEVEWTEDHVPRFQTICEEAPAAVDGSLVGRTVMCPLTSPHSGWFPAKVKKQVKRKGKKDSARKEPHDQAAEFVLGYTRKATKGLIEGDYETLLDLSEYGTGRKGRWVLLQERIVTPLEGDGLYCKRSCTLGRHNGDDHYMLLCEGCGVWFHGDCVGVVDGDIKEDEVWVCCQKCKYDLPRNLRADAFIGNSFKKQHEAGTACKAKIYKSQTSALPAAAWADDDDDDDVPILERAAAVTASRAPAAAAAAAAAAAVPAPPPQVAEAEEHGKGCRDAEAGARLDVGEAANEAAEGRGAVMKILEPLASFVGKSRMPKRDALAAVLHHIRGRQLFDPADNDYVLADAKLQTLTGLRPRVKLKKLAKRVAKYIVDDDGAAAGAANNVALAHVQTDASQDDTAMAARSQVPPVTARPAVPPASSGAKALLLTATSLLQPAPTPTTSLHSSTVLAAGIAAGSPHAAEINLKKRLGFGEPEVLSSPAALITAPGGTLVGASTSEEQGGEATAHEPQASKRRRLIADSDLAAASAATGAAAEAAAPGAAQAGSDRLTVWQSGAEGVPPCTDESGEGHSSGQHLKRKAPQVEPSALGQESEAACKKKRAGIEVHAGEAARDDAPARLAPPLEEAARAAATVAETPAFDDDDDDEGLDLDALEAQALATDAKGAAAPTSQAQAKEGDFDDDDDLEGLTAEQINDMERRAVLGAVDDH